MAKLSTNHGKERRGSLELEQILPLTRAIPDDPYGKAKGSLHRSLEILELFAVEQRPLSVGEIAEKLGYPQSSTSVMLHRLANLGYLRHDRHNRTFMPTARVIFLGLWMHHRILNDVNLLAAMEELAEHSCGVAMLGMQNGLHAQYIHIVAARSSRVGLKPGLLRPICRAAIGKILLSMKTKQEIRMIVRNVNAVEKGKAEPVDANALIAELEKVNETGFAETRNSVNPGGFTVAVRVPIDVDGTPLALGLSNLSSEIEEKRLLQQLITKTFGRYFPFANQWPRHVRPTVLAPRRAYAIS